MKLYLDTNTWLLATAAAGSNTTVILQAKQGSDLKLEIVPDRPLAENTSGSLVVKAKDAYASASVSWDLQWDAPVSSESGYLFELPLNTQPLAELLGGSNKSTLLMGEVTITEEGRVSKSQTITIVVNRQVSSGEEGTPAELPDLKASQEEAEAGTDNIKWMTPLRTAEAIAALAGGTGNGLSAYEIAVANGFQGSESEWLASLQGSSTPSLSPFSPLCSASLTYNAIGKVERIDFYLNDVYQGAALVFYDEENQPQVINYFGADNYTLLRSVSTQYTNGVLTSYQVN